MQTACQTQLPRVLKTSGGTINTLSRRATRFKGEIVRVRVPCWDCVHPPLPPLYHRPQPLASPRTFSKRATDVAQRLKAAPYHICARISAHFLFSPPQCPISTRGNGDESSRLTVPAYPLASGRGHLISGRNVCNFNRARHHLPPCLFPTLPPLPRLRIAPCSFEGPIKSHSISSLILYGLIPLYRLLQFCARGLRFFSGNLLILSSLLSTAYISSTNA